MLPALRTVICQRPVMPGRTRRRSSRNAGEKCLHVVVRKRTRADEAHVAPQHRPQLRQLVDAEAPEQAADDGDQPRIVLQLVARLPFVAQPRIGGEMLLEPAFRVAPHRPDLRNRDPASVEAGAILDEERRPAIEQSDERRGDEDDRRRDEQRERAEHEIERALDRRLPCSSRLFVYSMPTSVAEVADLQSFDRQVVVVAQQHDVTEVPLQTIDRCPVAGRIGATALEQRDPDAARRKRRRLIDAADDGNAFDLRKVRIDRRFDRQDGDGPVADVAGLLDAANRAGGTVAGADDDDRFAPPGPAAGGVRR